MSAILDALCSHAHNWYCIRVNAQRNRAVAARKEPRSSAESRSKQGDTGSRRRQRRIAEDEARKKRRAEYAGIADDKRRRSRKNRPQHRRGQGQRSRRCSGSVPKQASKAEEYEAYVAQIGLAAAKINDNAYDYASEAA